MGALIQLCGFIEYFPEREPWEGKDSFLIPYRDVAALARRVPEEEFGEAILPERLNDLEWMKAQLVTHERVLEDAMRTSTVVPLKWGTLFRSEEAVHQTLATRFLTIREQLNRLKGREEWTVKVWVDPERLNEWVSATHPAIQPLKREIAQRPSGTAYLLNERLKRLTKEVAQEQIQAVVQEVYAQLMKHAEASAPADPVGEPTPPNGRELVFQMVFLVTRDEQLGFSEAVLQAAQDWKTHGFGICRVGPFPAYYFSRLGQGETLNG